MLEMKPKTVEAIKAGRFHWFVFFDFMFMPTRVHCGDEPIESEGHTWTGVGAVLRSKLSFSSTVISPLFGQHESGEPQRGHVTASLPLDGTSREVVSKGYYRGRKMEIFASSFDKHGKIIERVACAAGTIVDVGLKDNIVTFTAENDTFDTIEKKEERRLKTVEDYRAQFRENLSGAVSSSGTGWLFNMLAATGGSWAGIILDVALSFRRSNRRALAQRWYARKRTYRFTTTPHIPRKWKRKKGYAIRADSLAEARGALYTKVERKIWLFPRGWINLIIECDEAPTVFLDLDQIRKADDPERWEATDRLGKWGRGDD